MVTWLPAGCGSTWQPVPPIYQPEVAAEAVAYAADHPQRREYRVGGSTVGTLLANRIAPGLLDRYLARTGFAAQQTDEPNESAGGNLWAAGDEAAGSDRGAHGRFDEHARSHSAQLWASRRRGRLAGFAMAGAGILLAVALRKPLHGAR
jgi:hypothetical protein